ncbi:MAG: pectate lyase, partial [Planctomycetes bacterium]|nr:pectate lyase [Planctomycetota bacterium]
MRIFNTKLAVILLAAWVFGAIQPGATFVLADAQVLAFPGAEGYGRFAQGGRGGDVYHVTHLGDSGPGSIRHGIETAEGPRTIVFDLSGTIELKSNLGIREKSKITIAGQTAPGDGITLKDHGLNLSQSSDIIIRYIRVR